MKKVQPITLRNNLGSTLMLTNVGAAIMSLTIKDALGNFTNVVAGLKDAAAYTAKPYQKSRRCLGATVGRYAGRISQGGFSLDGINYKLENEKGVHLHGGSKGFQNQIWEVGSLKDTTNSKAVFRLISPEGTYGYPGNLEVCATYELTNDNELIIEYTATTDKKTVLNLTNHAYFNLNGGGSVGEHVLKINADHILETNAQLIPAGKQLDVANTIYDYRTKSPVYKQNFKGLDTVYVLNNLKPQLTIESLESGIKMEVTTNQKAIVVFTPPTFEGLDLSIPNKAPYPAICFETQNFPDAPNNPNFPTTVLRLGETYRNRSQFKFIVA